MQLNSEPAAELFLNPRNVGDAAQPSFIGRSSSFNCGAALRISLQVDRSQRIIEAKFKAAGCSALVASASLLTDQVIGKTTGEAAELGQQPGAIENLLCGFAEDRIDCAALVCEALLSAIARYSDTVRNEWNGDEALVCTCFGVSERTIEREIQENHLSTIAEVTRACNAGAGCRSCYPLIEDIMDDYWRTK
ncbi:MAG: iron-sulfur cluster assembly scaffold protein [Pyrinomonadaceae bacterium]|nr:iron-sulfur cluster assembly scaffold protein [Pyrinomonadaceae bacterium]